MEDAKQSVKWRRLTLVYASDITPPLRRAVLAYLAFRAGDDDWCWPHQETIAAAVGIDVRSVRRHIEALEAAGWIVDSERRPGRRGVQYRLFNPSLELVGQMSLTPPFDRTPVTGQPFDRTHVSNSPDTSDRSDRTHVSGAYEGTEKEHQGTELSTDCGQVGHSWAELGPKRFCRNCRISGPVGVAG